MKKAAADAPSPESIVRAAGLRRTPVRVGVLRVLAAADGPLDVPTLVGRLPDETDAVTVYRTLNTFTRKKLVHRVRGRERSWLYALGRSTADEPATHRHPHFVCDDCGSVDCLNGATIPTTLVKSLGGRSRLRRQLPRGGVARPLPQVPVSEATCRTAN